MSIVEAIILGIIQGLTEFIPISSTAHLTLAGHIMGLIGADNPERWTAFIAVIQLGTLAAVLIYFAREIKSVPAHFFKENIGASRKTFGKQSAESKLGWQIIIGSIPIVLVGLALKKIIESDITKDPTVIAISLIMLALVLLLAERIAKFRKSLSETNYFDALIVGLAQCLALIPGASRSGTTITAGLFLGIKREDAARFSFLLSIPAVFGSGLLEFYQALHYITSADLAAIITATIAAGISGYASIAFLIKFLRTRSTMLFIVYRIILGLSILMFF